jgi:hypothetical protein
MFRRGGPANDGIMSGIEDRKKLADGTGLDVDRARLESMAISNIMDELAPIPKTRLPLGTVGFALASGADPIDALGAGYQRFIKADDARQAALAKRQQAAVSTALGSQLGRKGQNKIAVEKLVDLAIKSGEFPNTPEGRQEAFKVYSKSASDYLRQSTEQKIQSERSILARTDTTASEEEAQYNVLSREGMIPIKGEDYGEIDIAYDKKLITENEEFGPGDGFFNITDGKFYILKPGGNKEDFSSNSYDIIVLKSLY